MLNKVLVTVFYPSSVVYEAILFEHNSPDSVLCQWLLKYISQVNSGSDSVKSIFNNFHHQAPATPPIQLWSLGIVTFSKYRNSIISNSTPVPPLLARYLFRHRCVAQIEIFILTARLRWYQSRALALVCSLPLSARQPAVTLIPR